MSHTVYNVLLAIHIMGVAMWLGSNLAMGIGSARAQSASAEVNAWWAETQLFIGRTVKNAAFGLLLITGIGMVTYKQDLIDFKSPFVSVGFLVVIVGGALVGAVYAPGAKKMAAAYRSGELESAKTTGHNLGAVGMLDTMLVVITILFMVFKWGS